MMALDDLPWQCLGDVETPTGNTSRPSFWLCCSTLLAEMSMAWHNSAS